MKLIKSWKLLHIVTFPRSAKSLNGVKSLSCQTPISLSIPRRALLGVFDRARLYLTHSRGEKSSRERLPLNI